MSLGGRFFRLICIFSALGAGTFFFSYWLQQRPHARYGFTYSSYYANSLGLVPDQVLVDVLDAFSPDFVRLPIYWDAVELEEGQYTWDAVDGFIQHILDAGADVHVVIGAKVPRWPECFVPSWVNTQQQDQFEKSLLSYERAVIERYHDRVTIWQVENEPFFAFGDCPAPDLSLLKKEIQLVHDIDIRAQVQITVSGEQQVWGSVFSLADRIGVSMYRRARSVFFGSISFPIAPTWYVIMRAPLQLFLPVSVSELQMEPWFTSHPRYIDPQLASSYFTEQDAKNTLAFVRMTGFSEVSFWGVEWWYYLREHGYPQVWNVMRDMLER